MKRRRKFTQEEKTYWAEVLIAMSQITFGAAWATPFIPIDLSKMNVIIFNLSLSIIFWFVGWFLIRRKKK